MVLCYIYRVLFLHIFFHQPGVELKHLNIWVLINVLPPRDLSLGWGMLVTLTCIRTACFGWLVSNCHWNSIEPCGIGTQIRICSEEFGESI